jgi:DNA-binding CsgD family transcriptional regulator
LLGAAAAVRAAIGTPLPDEERAWYDRARATSWGQLGESRFAAARSEGEAMPADVAITDALAAADLFDQMPPTQPGAAVNDRLGLTPRERQVLKLVAEYKTSKEIADEMGSHYRTVENHRTNICRKLDIHGSHVLLRFALRYKSELL